MDKELKELMEKRSAALAEMKRLTEALHGKDGETRAFTSDELTAFNKAKEDVEKLNATIAVLNEQRAAALADSTPIPADGEKLTKEQIEERAFVDYIRSGAPIGIETRADSNFTKDTNGAVIPASIANKIIERVKTLSPLFSMASHYNVPGTLNIPYYDETSGTVTMAYSDEFSELESSSGKFISISLGGFLAGALCKVSKSLINNSQFDLLPYIVNKVAESIAAWIDGQLINGTTGKIEGLIGVKQIVTTAQANLITADSLIDLQDSVPDAYQAGAVWLMSAKTRSHIRKLKDGEGNYLLNKDATTKWGYSLFGKPVYIADAMPDMAAGKPAVYYGDFSGLAIKTSEAVNIEVLREKYATQHAVGIVAWLEMDAKIENAQKISVLKMAAK